MGLDRVRVARQQLAGAHAERTDAMTEAIAEGLSVSAVAEAAAVTRQTVYRLTRVSRDEPGPFSDREVLDARLIG